MGVSWAVLDAVKTKRVHVLNNYAFLTELDSFGPREAVLRGLQVWVQEPKRDLMSVLRISQL